jgi:phage-related protein
MRDFGKKLGDGIDGPARDAGDRAGHGFSGAFGNSLKSLAVVAGSAFAAIGIGSFVKGSVEAASDFNEELSKSNTVFKDQAGEIEAWSKTAAKGFGQSQKSALGAASSFGNMFRQLGIGGEEAAKMSTQMVELASDFASFHNADITEVLQAQQSAFRGEYDAVQRFVPTITAASVEQKALALGLAGSTKELTAQDKALATQALLLEGAGDAMGDFDRTSSSMANQQRILGALWEDAKIQIGTALLPAVTSIVRFLVSDGIPAFLGFADGVGSVVGTVRDAFSTIAGIISSGGTENELSSGMQGVIERIGLAALTVKDVVQANWPAVRDATLEVVGQLRDMAAAAWESRDAIAAVVIPLGTFATVLVTIAKVNTGIAAVSTALGSIGPLIAAKLGPMLAAAGPIGIGIAVVLALAAAAFFAYKKFEPFRNVIDTIGRTIRDVALVAFENFRAGLPVVAAAFSTAFGAIRGAIETVIGVFAAFGAKVAGLYQTVVIALTPLATWFNANVVSTFVAGWNLIVAIFQLAVSQVGGGISLLIAIVQPALEFVKAQFQILWTVISTILQAIFVVIQTSVGFWVDAFSTFIGIVGPIWSGFWDVVWTMASTILQQIQNTIETVLGIIRGVFIAVTGIIQGDWGTFWDGISTIASSVFNGVRDAISIIWDSIKTLFSTAMDTVKNTVTNGFNEVVTFVGTIPGRITSAIGDLSRILFNAGRQIIQGLIDGVQSMIGSFTGLLGQLTSMIPKSKGPPSRDAMLLYANGQLIMRGLMAGIESAVPSLRSQLSGLTGMIGHTSLLSPSGLGLPAGAGAAGAPSVVQNFYQPMNERTAAEEMGWQLRLIGG